VSDVRAALSVAYDGPALVPRDVIDDTCRKGMRGLRRDVRRYIEAMELACVIRLIGALRLRFAAQMVPSSASQRRGEHR
jgi:hypothetical protein